jgi:pyruvate,water dikinase
MVPFVRTLKEARSSARDHESSSGWRGKGAGKEGLKIVMMCEIPSNAILAAGSNFWNALMDFLLVPTT